MRWKMKNVRFLCLIGCCFCCTLFLLFSTLTFRNADKYNGNNIIVVDNSNIGGKKLTNNGAVVKNDKNQDVIRANDINDNGGGDKLSLDYVNDDVIDGKKSIKNDNVAQQQQQVLYGDLPCLINGERSLTCLRDNNDEIYLPFKSFLQKYYEVTGYVSRKADGEEIFEWWHSNARVHKPPMDQEYDPSGVFGAFSTYNVENRDRVKCISGIDGVPLSIQWGTQPYYYPVQIAQYALEHYSKNITEKSPLTVSYETGDKRITEVWRKAPESAKNTILERLFDSERKSNVLRFQTYSSSVENPGIFINLENNSSRLHEIRLWLKFSGGYNSSKLSTKNDSQDSSGFTVMVERTDTKTFYYMHYVQSDEPLRTAEPNQIFFGIGEFGRFNNRWRRITRNLMIDFSKGLMALTGTKKQKRLRLTNENVRFVSISFRGNGRLDDLAQRTTAHEDHFFDGAEFLVENQRRENGGFPVGVRRTFNDLKISLEPPWYSAMAQGHAMSVLCRAYAVTGDQRYRASALKAAVLFNVDADKGGVRNRFLDAYPWYEEYPTVPGTFVLNGFIYSLIGLYDAKTLCGDSQDELFSKLYSEGLKSLKTLLPLYDTGSGSVYDLRHVTLGAGGPPNVARWDYHSVHIYQLYWLYKIEDYLPFKTTADRWVAYSKGWRAKKN